MATHTTKGNIAFISAGIDLLSIPFNLTGHTGIGLPILFVGLILMAVAVLLPAKKKAVSAQDKPEKITSGPFKGKKLMSAEDFRMFETYELYDPIENVLNKINRMESLDFCGSQLAANTIRRIDEELNPPLTRPPVSLRLPETNTKVDINLTFNGVVWRYDAKLENLQDCKAAEMALLNLANQVRKQKGI